VRFAKSLRNDFSRWRDDAASASQIASFFNPGLGNTHYKRTVLISTCLHNKMVMKACQMIVNRHPWHAAWRVVAEHHEFDRLHTKYAVGLRPSSIVADAHSYNSAKSNAKRRNPNYRHRNSAFRGAEKDSAADNRRVPEDESCG